jgi:hypothetical protein
MGRKNKKRRLSKQDKKRQRRSQRRARELKRAREDVLEFALPLWDLPADSEADDADRVRKELHACSDKGRLSAT